MITRHACLSRAFLASTLTLSLLITPSVGAAATPNQAPVAPEPATAQAAQAAKDARAKRRASEREKRSQNLRRVMTSMGFGDRALQDEVLRHIAAEVRDRGLVRRRAQQMLNALRDPNTSEQEVRALLRDYQIVVETDRVRRRLAENALNERINFRDNPRLEAMLVIFGAIGDAPIALPPIPRPRR